jgi:hypothetical protein
MLGQEFINHNYQIFFTVGQLLFSWCIVYMCNLHKASVSLGLAQQITPELMQLMLQRLPSHLNGRMPDHRQA